MRLGGLLLGIGCGCSSGSSPGRPDALLLEGNMAVFEVTGEWTVLRRDNGDFELKR